MAVYPAGGADRPRAVSETRSPETVFVPDDQSDTSFFCNPDLSRELYGRVKRFYNSRNDKK